MNAVCLLDIAFVLVQFLLQLFVLRRNRLHDLSLTFFDLSSLAESLELNGFDLIANNRLNSAVLFSDFSCRFEARCAQIMRHCLNYWLIVAIACVVAAIPEPLHVLFAEFVVQDKIPRHTKWRVEFVLRGRNIRVRRVPRY